MDIDRSNSHNGIIRNYSNSVNNCNSSNNTNPSTNLINNIENFTDNKTSISNSQTENDEQAIGQCNGSATNVILSRLDDIKAAKSDCVLNTSVSNGLVPNGVDNSNAVIYDVSLKSYSTPVETHNKLPLCNGDFAKSLENDSVDKVDANQTSINLIGIPSYNDYVNKIYIDSSRRQSVQHDSVDGLKPIIDENRDDIHFLSGTADLKSGADDQLNPLLSYFEKNNEKRPKSIVKSPSSQSFSTHSNCNTGAGLNNYKTETNSLAERSTASVTSNDADRPVLHVQFMSHQNGAPTTTTTYSSSNRRKSECKSPVGSIISRTSRSSDDSKASSSSSSTSSSSSSSSSIGQYSEARPPDGGWGWVVVFASFMVNLIADGVTFSFGVIFVEFLNYFGEGKAKTAWIGSLFMAIPLLSGPIASFLTDRYGCRKVTIAGSILSCIGFVISSFSNSMEMLFFTFGILAGFGLSLCYVAAVVIVAYYFESKRSFATGLSVCGSGIGTFIFAPLTHSLLEEYGWRGTTLILAGIFLNMCVCGVLMRDLEWTTHRAKLKAKERKRSRLGVSADSFSVSNSTNTGGTNSNLNQTTPASSATANQTGDRNNSVCNNVGPEVRVEDLDDSRLFSSLVTLPTFVRNGEKVPIEVLELLSTHRNVHNLLLQNYPTLIHSRSFSEPLSSHNGLSREGSFKPNDQNTNRPTINYTNPTQTERFNNDQALLSWIKKHGHHNHARHQPSTAYLKDLRIHRHSLTYRGAMLNINRYRLRASSCPDIYRNSMTTIAKEKTHCCQVFDEFRNLLVDLLDFSHFADIRFLLFALSNFLLYTWYDVPYVYLTDNAIEIGINEDQAPMLIAIIGIVNMFGEIFLGWLGDVKWISASLVYAVCMALCGAVTALVPLLHSYEWLSIVSGLFGLFIAANYALTSIILVELITLERFTNAYGLLLLVQGIANLVGPPLAGWIYDLTGTYDLSFYIAGFFIAISGLMLIILPAMGKYRKYRALRRQTSEQVETPKISSIGTDSSTSKLNGTSILSDCLSKELLKDTVKANHV